MNRVRNTSQAFTLIELLFVIALLGVLTTAAVMVIRRHQTAQRVDRAASETMQILQAASAYYADYEKWPSATTDAPSCVASTSDANAFVQSYLPNANVRSVFGLNYCWGEQSDNLFWVALRLPASIAGTQTSALATQIAAQLPNAVLTQTPMSESVTECAPDRDCYVRAEVPRPGVGSTAYTASGMSIAAVGDCKPKSIKPNPFDTCKDLGYRDGKRYYQITFPACPADVGVAGAKTSARVVAMPNFYHYFAKKENDSQHAIARFAAEQAGDCVRLNGTPAKEQCKLVVAMEVCSGFNCKHYSIQAYQSKVGLSYVVACAAAQSTRLAKAIRY